MRQKVEQQNNFLAFEALTFIFLLSFAVLLLWRSFVSRLLLFFAIFFFLFHLVLLLSLRDNNLTFSRHDLTEAIDERTKETHDMRTNETKT